MTPPTLSHAAFEEMIKLAQHLFWVVELSIISYTCLCIEIQ